MNKTVLVVSVDEQDISSTFLHNSSLDKQGISVVNERVNYCLTSPGFLFNEISVMWMKSECDYITYLPSTCYLPENRLSEQIKFMEQNNLCASYSNLERVTYLGEPLNMIAVKEFSYNMIGTSCIPTEGLLIDRKMFIESGGLDYAFSGVYKPNTYLTTMLALAGKIAKFSGSNVFYLNDIGILEEDAKNLWKNESTKRMFERLNFERFILKAREYYKGRY